MGRAILIIGAGALAVGVIIYALIECAQSDKYAVRAIPKWGWLLVILLLPVVGAVLWLFFGRPRTDDAARDAARGVLTTEQKNDIRASVGGLIEEMADLVVGQDAGHIAGFWARAWRDINFLGHKGVPVVVATKVYDGRALPVYGFKGGGNTLLKAGAVFADDLTPDKARILTLIALPKTKDRAALQALFDR